MNPLDSLEPLPKQSDRLFFGGLIDFSTLVQHTVTRLAFEQHYGRPPLLQSDIQMYLEYRRTTLPQHTTLYLEISNAIR